MVIGARDINFRMFCIFVGYGVNLYFSSVSYCVLNFFYILNFLDFGLFFYKEEVSIFIL